MEEALRWRPRRMRPAGHSSAAPHGGLGSREPSRRRPGPRPTPRRSSWLTLDRFIHCSDRDVESGRDGGGSGTASETSYTCTGRPIRASLRAADPPAVSRLHLHWPAGRRESNKGLSEPAVVAAHGHSILFRAITPFEEPEMHGYHYFFPVDWFVYSAFSSPPSLLLLPPCFIGGVSIPEQDTMFEPFVHRQQRTMLSSETGLLCHGDGGGDFTVVDFTFFHPTAELCLLHHHAPASSSSGEDQKIEKEGSPPVWRIKKVRLPEGRYVHRWVTDTIVPVDGRFLLWVDTYQGILVVDVLLANDQSRGEEELQLRYIPLPTEALRPGSGRRMYAEDEAPDPARSVGLTPTGKIMLVCITPGGNRNNGPAAAFAVRSWILQDLYGGKWHSGYTMQDDEFWGLCHGRSLPVVKPMYPLVSLVRADAISFQLEEDRSTYWMVEVDMRKRVLKSSAVYINEEEGGEEGDRVRRNFFHGHCFIPSEISSYLGRNAIGSLELSEIMQKAKQWSVMEKRRSIGGWKEEKLRRQMLNHQVARLKGSQSK